MSEVIVDTLKHTGNNSTANLTLASNGNVTAAAALSATSFTGDGSALTGTGLFSSYALICDEKTEDTDGGTTSAGDWFKRDLNTEIADPDSIVSISSDQFTLGAGNYLIKWSVPNYKSTYTSTRLYDTTNSAVVGQGSNAYANTSGIEHVTSFGQCRVTPTGSTVYELQNRVSTGNANTGCGRANDFTGVPERYSFVEIYKEA